MTRAVFVDTSAWYAMSDADDAGHASAVRRFRRLAEARRQPLTTNHVIAESYTLLRGRLGFRPAQRLLESFRRTSFVQRYFVPEVWEADAEHLLERYDDQAFSYVDATSFVTMRRLGIQEALAFDRDFVIAGFTLLGDE
jgi:uncharacterized protein